MRPLGRFTVGVALFGSVFPVCLPAQEGSRPVVSGVQEEGAYERGLKLKGQGSWAEALMLWEEATGFFTAPADPRIAFAFLETTMENNATERVELACEMVLWGLTGNEFPTHLRGPLVQELDRILPLLDEEEVENWTALRDSSTQRIAWELKHYWIEKDPTPTTILNERLIEHWRRIVHVRREFRYSADSPYGTDDRGTVWVKYGPPGRRKSGALGASEMELKIRVPLDVQAREAIRRYDTNPQYEVWVYDDLNDQGFTYFLFGSREGQGRFGLVDGVRDLIPLASRSQGSSRYVPGGVPAAYYLELFYYETLSRVGGYFGRRFAELDELWNQYTTRTNWEGGGRVSPTENTLRSYSQKYELQDRHDPENPPLHPVSSLYEGRAQAEMVVQAVRVLRDNEPRLLILALSASRSRAPERSAPISRLPEVPGSGLLHTLIVRDERLFEVGRLIQPLSPSEGDVSVFQLRHPEHPMHLTLAEEEPMARDSAAPQAVDVGFEDSRTFPAHAHIEPRPPLSADTAHLEVSDLALGLQVPDNIEGSNFPFPLLPAPRIWQSDNLRVYLEIYHLALDEDRAGRFQAQFRVQALRADGNVDEGRGPVTLSVQIQTVSSSFAAPFDIDVGSQRPGRYRVDVMVTDLLRGETVSRSATLQIMG